MIARQAIDKEASHIGEQFAVITRAIQVSSGAVCQGPVILACVWACLFFVIV